MATSRQYVERDLVELGYTAQCLIERAHNRWFWGYAEAGEGRESPSSLWDRVQGMQAALRYLAEQDLGADVQRLAQSAESSLLEAWDVYRQRWPNREHGQLTRAIDDNEGVLSPEAEEKCSPLAFAEWSKYRSVMRELSAALPKGLSDWVNLGGLMAQVLSLGGCIEQAQILGEPFPIDPLRRVLRRVRDGHAVLSDLDVELPDPDDHEYVESVERKAKCIRKAILDRLAKCRPNATVAVIETPHNLGEADKVARQTTGASDSGHSKVLVAGGSGGEKLIEQEPPYVLIPPNQFAWKANPPIELTPQQWKLLSYCLANRRAEVQDVADHLWGVDSSSDKSESAIDSQKSKLNSRLTEAKIPISLSRKAGFLILSIDA